jgi:hypothetical protein
MLEILLWTIAAILILAFSAVASVLCMPIRISFMFDTHNRPAFSFKMAPFGGLLPIVLTSERWKKRSTKQRTKAASNKSRKALHQNVAALAPRILRELPELISKVVSRVKLERVDANIRFGLSDPANTGILYGALIPLLQLIGVSERSYIVLKPDFGNEIFDGSGHMATRFVPIALIAPMLGFAWVTMVLPRLSGVFR